MVRNKRTIATLLVGLALVGVSGSNGAHLTLAMEDRADPNPRQISLAVKLAGLGLGVAISWTEQLRDEVD